MGYSEPLGRGLCPATPRERRRSAILDAAEKLFIEQGYERTGLAEIVKRSGGSLATLYDLFGNKQGLLQAIATRWRDQTMANLVACNEADCPSHIDLLISYARHRSETLKSPRTVALARILVSESLRDRDFATQVYRDFHIPWIRELSALFADWTAKGEAEIDDPEATAEMFLSLISGDSPLNSFTRVEDGVLTEAQIVWRLRPFFAYFKIV